MNSVAAAARLYFPLGGFGEATSAEGLGMSREGECSLEDEDFLAEDIVAGWWLHQFERIDFLMGDQFAVVGCESVCTAAAEIAGVLGAGRRIRVITARGRAELSTPEVESLKLSECGLEIAEELGKWFSKGPGRAVLCVIDPSLSVAALSLKVLPSWGCLLLGESIGRTPLEFGIDLYRDVHRRGCVVMATVPWSHDKGLNPDAVRCLRRARNLREHGRTRLRVTRCSIEDGWSGALEDQPALIWTDGG